MVELNSLIDLIYKGVQSKFFQFGFDEVYHKYFTGLLLSCIDNLLLVTQYRKESKYTCLNSETNSKVMLQSSL